MEIKVYLLLLIPGTPPSHGSEFSQLRTVVMDVHIGMNLDSCLICVLCTALMNTGSTSVFCSLLKAMTSASSV